MTHKESKPAEGEAFKTEHLKKRNIREQTYHVREDKRRPLRHQRRIGNIGTDFGTDFGTDSAELRREAIEKTAGTECAWHSMKES